MKKTILLLLTLTLILSVFSSCGYKTTNLTETETNNLQTKATTIVYEETTEGVDEEILEETTSETSEESIETTSYTETVNTTETMESIETDNGVTKNPINTEEEVDYPSKHYYTMQKVGDQWYMVYDTYLCDPEYDHLTCVPF